MFSSLTGIIHFIASVIALVAGTLVLVKTKGTGTHKKLGYLYCIGMVTLLVTSFMIFDLHGTFGILHVFSVVSSITLLGGMVPMLFKRTNNYIAYHFSFMYWSVIGLYCAFAAEIFTRIPILFKMEESTFVLFYSLVGISAALVGGIGSIYFRTYKKSWEKFNIK